MKKPILCLMFIVLFALSFIPAKPQTQPQPLVLIHVAVVDVKNAQIKPDTTIVILGNRITEFGEDGKVNVPKEAQVIDARGKFLIPGLWDMHVHLGNATEAALTVLVTSGVTGVRDMGSPSFETLRRWRVETLGGKRVAPRIVAAGPILDGGPPDSNRIIVRNEEEARRAVDYLAEIGVDFIKVHEHISRDVYFAIADEARKQGLPLAGHVPVNEKGFAVSGIEASNAGQKSLEHLFGIPFNPKDKSMPDLLTALRQNGTRITPTLIVFWNRAHIAELSSKPDPRIKYAAPALKQFWEQQIRGFSSDVKVPEFLLKSRMSAVKALYDAGIPLLAGTDLGFPYVIPGDITKELEYLVAAGLPPVEALRAATINATRYLGRDSELGTVEKDKLADLILLEANPLEDIRNTAKINAVILNGRLLDRKTLDKLLAEAENPSS